MAGEKESALAAALAACPVCNENIPLENMNSHIDICLLAGALTPHSVSRPGVASQLGYKRSSDSSSPAPGDGKQLLLSFGRRDSPGAGGHLPPAKSRKLASTPKSSRNLQSLSNVNKGSGRRPIDIPREEDTSGSQQPPLVSGAGELSAPLAEVMRPTSIEEYVGQEGIIGKNAILRTILESGQVPSLIFWGPPGCGKTTLARIIARVARGRHGTRFTQLSATTSGVNDVKEVVKLAKNDRAMLKRKTILFIDEIHRFNKLQQDTFLPHVEDGTITLLGATTENPSFQLNSALLSRCRVIVLEKLKSPEIENLLRRALPKVGAVENTTVCAHNEHSSPKVFVEPQAIATLAQLCDGDARSALNGLQLAVQAKRERFLQQNCKQSDTSVSSSQSEDVTTTPTNQDHSSMHERTGSQENTHVLEMEPPSPHPEDSLCTHHSHSVDSKQLLYPIITIEDVKESLQRTHLLYDRAGEEHYNIISALHKSMRGSDVNASLYWLARMLCAGEDPLYVARRVVRFASEDIGLADPNALSQAVAAFQACQFIGMPECDVNLAQAVVYMARAPKSIEVCKAYSQAKASVKGHKGPLPSVPLHLRNAPTRLMKDLGYSKGYKYNPDYCEPVDQQYMPEGLEGMNFFTD